MILEEIQHHFFPLSFLPSFSFLSFFISHMTNLPQGKERGGEAYVGIREKTEPKKRGGGRSK